MLIFAVIPRPPAAFSPLTITKSRAYFDFNSGNRATTPARPGCPTISPRKRIVNMRGRIVRSLHHCTGFAIHDLRIRRPKVAKRFLIQTSLLLFATIVANGVRGSDNISVLGNKPRWAVLERYEQTI